MQDRANNRDRVLVIIPAFNEHETLPSTLAELKRTVPDFDVVVIDDGSKDDTADLAEANGVICIRLPFNLGIGGALRIRAVVKGSVCHGQRHHAAFPISSSKPMAFSLTLAFASAHSTTLRS